MLILTREEGQRLTIGDDVAVIVLGFEEARDGVSRVKLGIDAPHEVQILRDEAKARGPRK